MRKWSVAVIGLFVLIYIVPLGVRPVANPDETRYAEIPREMIVSGNWIVPHLNGLRYFEKPVLGYWLNAISITLFGENAFAIRFPSAISAGISALMLFLLVRKYGGGHAPGILAAAAFLTSPLVFAIATINILDTGLSMFLTCAMVFFLFSHMTPEPGKKRLFLTLFGVSCGLAFLVKGFLAFLVPAIAIVPFTVWEGRWKELLKWAWLPILAAIVVVLPWAVMVHLREGDYWNYFFWTEHINRFIAPGKGQHPKPFWYFIPIVVGGALPWMVLLPVAVWGLWKKVTREPLIRFAICWFLFPFLFFSASSGKLIPYILPCMPPIVIIITVGLLDYFRAGRQKAFNILTASFAAAIGIVAVGLILGKSFDLSALNPYGHGEVWKWATAVTGFLFWGVFLLWVTRAQGSFKKIALYCMAPLLFMFTSQFVVPEKMLEGRTPESLIMRNAHRVSPKTIVVSDNHAVSAVCWFLKRNDIYLLHKSGELAYGLRYKRSKDSRLLTYDQFRDLIRGNADKSEVALFTDSERYEKNKNLLPTPVFQDKDLGFVFSRF